MANVVFLTSKKHEDLIPKREQDGTRSLATPLLVTRTTGTSCESEFRLVEKSPPVFSLSFVTATREINICNRHNTTLPMSP